MDYAKPNPKLRNEYIIEIRASIANFIQRHISSSELYPYRSCLNCTHWKFTEELCGKYNSRPPAEIIVYSCPEHEDNDDIPF